jgi:hypothetical protein
MTNLTSELNLIQGELADDTANYLTIDLANSLNILDGLFNNSTGHTHSGAHQGAVLGANSFVDNTIPGAKLADGSVTYAKLAANLLESLFTGSLVNQSANYVVQAASPVMFVQCHTTITVTLTAGIQRPITVRANAGNTTVTSTAGTVVGGSIDTATGAVINGRVNQGDSVTYKWDSSNWVAI